MQGGGGVWSRNPLFWTSSFGPQAPSPRDPICPRLHHLLRCRGPHRTTQPTEAILGTQRNLEPSACLPPQPACCPERRPPALLRQTRAGSPLLFQTALEGAQSFPSLPPTGAGVHSRAFHLLPPPDRQHKKMHPAHGLAFPANHQQGAGAFPVTGHLPLPFSTSSSDSSTLKHGAQN